MLKQEIEWFFIIFGSEFRLRTEDAFQTFMLLALAHFFGFYNPKQFADFLNIRSRCFYEDLKEFSLYSLKTMLLKFMVIQAAEHLKPVLCKSDATRSRSGITLSADNSVIDRPGRMFRCMYSWYSGRCKKVVRGNDLPGIVLTVRGIVIPLHLLFCSKQGRGNTDKPSMLISMMTALKEEFGKHGIGITQFPVTMDSWFVSENLKKELRKPGFHKIVIAGKGNYVFDIKNKKQKASFRKKEVVPVSGQWATDVSSCRVKAESPTFGETVLFFFEKSTTRTYYLMDFSQNPMRGAEMWHIWKQHHLIEHFRKLLKSVFKIKSMQLQGDGLYAGLPVKILSYLLTIRLKSHKPCSKLSLVQIMRKIRRDSDLEQLINEHFHLSLSVS